MCPERGQLLNLDLRYQFSENVTQVLSLILANVVCSADGQIGDFPKHAHALLARKLVGRYFQFINWCILVSNRWPARAARQIFSYLQ